MNPGVTTAPDASISLAPSTGRSGLTSTISLPRTRTSARRAGAPVPSTTSPPRIRISLSDISRFYHRPGWGGQVVTPTAFPEEEHRLGLAVVGDRVPDVLRRLLRGQEIAG